MNIMIIMIIGFVVQKYKEKNQKYIPVVITGIFVRILCI